MKNRMFLWFLVIYFFAVSSAAAFSPVAGNLIAAPRELASSANPKVEAGAFVNSAYYSLINMPKSINAINTFKKHRNPMHAHEAITFLLLGAALVTLAIFSIKKHLKK
ncbi:MAG: hypothetical protein JXK94_14860 [Deltaproteobacteria bacterium]|nr:hypothetical protein [Deltaproteobacteria bacterium]